ncbi:hypothetical protein AYI69_g4817 [Smittium culicis]|uniref:Uncharacterized protein n=1 Tax=Smittium culicis TaxID=133412 RepID=A0A1R1YB79_9FUNG|nr:hypothetical protein AYI69_g4817 [Smittium culicis]
MEYSNDNTQSSGNSNYASISNLSVSSFGSLSQKFSKFESYKVLPDVGFRNHVSEKDTKILNNNKPASNRFLIQNIKNRPKSELGVIKSKPVNTNNYHSEGSVVGNNFSPRKDHFNNFNVSLNPNSQFSKHNPHKIQNEHTVNAYSHNTKNDVNSNKYSNQPFELDNPDGTFILGDNVDSSFQYFDQKELNFNPHTNNESIPNEINSFKNNDLKSPSNYKDSSSTIKITGINQSHVSMDNNHTFSSNISDSKYESFDYRGNQSPLNRNNRAKNQSNQFNEINGNNLDLKARLYNSTLNTPQHKEYLNLNSPKVKIIRPNVKNDNRSTPFKSSKKFNTIIKPSIANFLEIAKTPYKNKKLGNSSINSVDFDEEYILTDNRVPPVPPSLLGSITSGVPTEYDTSFRNPNDYFHSENNGNIELINETDMYLSENHVNNLKSDQRINIKKLNLNSHRAKSTIQDLNINERINKWDRESNYTGNILTQNQHISSRYEDGNYEKENNHKKNNLFNATDMFNQNQDNPLQVDSLSLNNKKNVSQASINNFPEFQAYTTNNSNLSNNNAHNFSSYLNNNSNPKLNFNLNTNLRSDFNYNSVSNLYGLKKLNPSTQKLNHDELEELDNLLGPNQTGTSHFPVTQNLARATVNISKQDLDDLEPLPSNESSKFANVIPARETYIDEKEFYSNFNSNNPTSTLDFFNSKTNSDIESNLLQNKNQQIDQIQMDDADKEFESLGENNEDNNIQDILKYDSSTSSTGILHNQNAPNSENKLTSLNGGSSLDGSRIDLDIDDFDSVLSEDFKEMSINKNTDGHLSLISKINRFNKDTFKGINILDSPVSSHHFVGNTHIKDKTSNGGPSPSISKTQMIDLVNCPIGYSSAKKSNESNYKSISVKKNVNNENSTKAKMVDAAVETTPDKNIQGLSNYNLILKNDQGNVGSNGETPTNNYKPSDMANIQNDFKSQFNNSRKCLTKSINAGEKDSNEKSLNNFNYKNFLRNDPIHNPSPNSHNNNHLKLELSADTPDLLKATDTNDLKVYPTKELAKTDNGHDLSFKSSDILSNTNDFINLESQNFESGNFFETQLHIERNYSGNKVDIKENDKVLKKDFHLKVCGEMGNNHKSIHTQNIHVSRSEYKDTPSNNSSSILENHADSFNYNRHSHQESPLLKNDSNLETTSPSNNDKGSIPTKSISLDNKNNIEELVILLQSRLENGLCSLLELERNSLLSEFATLKDGLNKAQDNFLIIKSELEKISLNKNNIDFEKILNFKRIGSEISQIPVLSNNQPPPSAQCQNQNLNFNDAQTQLSNNFKIDPTLSIQSSSGITNNSTMVASKIEQVLESYLFELNRVLNENKARDNQVHNLPSGLRLEETFNNNISLEKRLFEKLESQQYLNPSNKQNNDQNISEHDQGLTNQSTIVISSDSIKNQSYQLNQFMNKKIDSISLLNEGKSSASDSKNYHQNEKASLSPLYPAKKFFSKSESVSSNFSYPQYDDTLNIRTGDANYKARNINETENIPIKDNKDTLIHYDSNLVFKNIHDSDSASFHGKLLTLYPNNQNCPLCLVNLSELTNNKLNISSLNTNEVDLNGGLVKNAREHLQQTNMDKISSANNLVSESSYNSIYKTKTTSSDNEYHQKLSKKDKSTIVEPFNPQTLIKNKYLINRFDDKIINSGFSNIAETKKTYEPIRLDELQGRWQSWFKYSDPDLKPVDPSIINFNYSINSVSTKIQSRNESRSQSVIFSRYQSNSTRYLNDDTISNIDQEDHYSPNIKKNSAKNIEFNSEKIPFIENRDNDISSKAVMKNSIGNKPQTNKSEASKLLIKLLSEELSGLHRKQMELSKKLEGLNPTVYKENVSRREISKRIRSLSGLIDIKSEEIAILSNLY